ncbi:hypothetical protein OHA27_04540 [Streptomyces sp. NBC_01619]|uniref:Uncharacterized protein n=1 Tax=Streptomyces pratisoli TaxID=3139917 RepID=A0ACC6QEB7_9ACTN|nr:MULTISPECIES: hypothetical protein [unclassified Streptomyces]MCX4509579.1 hypothetical protein [Streptomyces sp. NBC_01619]
MGWTVLYIAFGIVALWLLGEVLLQYKARLRWRLVAFVGFLGVVVGVLMPNVIVIGIGAAAFAVGQTYVTLSFRRGFSTGWAIGGSPGSSRRRRSGGGPVDREPTLEVTDLAYEDSGPADPSRQGMAEHPDDGSSAVYEPQPLPEDTGQYGIYTDAAYANQGQGQGQGQNDSGYGTWSTGYADTYSQGHSYEQPVGAHDAYTGPYDYGTGQQQYAAYSDPYIGTQGYGSYDSYGGQQQYTDPYATQQGYGETPPGGVWVPQQRDGEQVPPMPPEQPSPYGYDQSGYETDYNGQTYRY